MKTSAHLLKFYKNGLYEAKNIYRACKEIKKMKNDKVFLSLTANLLNNHTYELLYVILEKKLVNVVVTTGDFIAFDILKSLANKNLDEKIFSENDKQTICDFIGEIVMPKHENCIAISEFVSIIGKKLGPSTLIGQAIKNGIKIYAPTICDSVLGFYMRGVRIDSLIDVININRESFFEKKTGAIILGSSTIKHAVLNVNIFKNGLNHCVIINTYSETDGSDSGGNVDEAVTWGKIHKNTGVKVFADPSIVFPIIARYWLKSQ